LLPPGTHISSITLTVKNLGRAQDFYEGQLGFIRQKHEASAVTLGASENGRPLIILEENTSAELRPRQLPGLFHAAFLYPSRYELARILQRLVRRGMRFQGFADHGVSEALYLSDPEGNGVELYADKPDKAWSWKDGQVQMGTDPLDLESLMSEIKSDNLKWSGTPPDTKIGHLHLQVSGIEPAESFWVKKVGFDITVRGYPGALFISAGGYHHHLGLNIWNSRGQKIPDDNITGLRSFSIVLPDREALSALGKRLETPLGENSVHSRDLDGIAVDFSSSV